MANPNIIGRRDFLKLSGYGLIGLFLPDFSKALQPRPSLLRRTDAQTIDEEKRLEEFGLSEFKEFYKTSLEILDTYAVMPPVFGDIFETLYFVAKGGIADSFDPKVQELRDDWNLHPGRKVDHAMAHIRDLDIDGTLSGQDPEEYRHWLYLKADNIPQLIMSIPKNLKILPFGSTLGYVNYERQEMGLPSLNNPWAEVTLIHEAHHMIPHIWKDLKAYTDKGAFIRYITTLMSNIKKVAETYAVSTSGVSNALFKSPVWQDFYLSGVEDSEQRTEIKQFINKSLNNILDGWSKKTGVQLEFTQLEDPDPKVNWINFIRNLTLHMKGLDPGADEHSERRDFMSKNGEIITPSLLTGLQIEINKEGQIYQCRLPGYFEAINHYLVDIVTDWIDDIPSRPVPAEGNIDKQARIEVQEALLEAFSTLGPDATQPEIREALDMSPLTLTETGIGLLITVFLLKGAKKIVKPKKKS